MPAVRSRWWVVLVTLSVACTLPWAALAGPITMAEASMVLSDSPTLPDDDAAWQRVSLPDRERRAQPGQSGTAAWYRMAFELPVGGPITLLGLFEKVEFPPGRRTDGVITDTCVGHIRCRLVGL